MEQLASRPAAGLAPTADWRQALADCRLALAG
jgi:hypothetical protein